MRRRDRLTLRFVGTAILLAGPIGCGSKPTEPPTRGPFSLVVARGDNQAAEVAGPLPAPIAIEARDSRGPAADVSVSFSVASGGGTVAPATAVSDTRGEVTFQWTLGPTAGSQTVTVTTSGAAAVTVNATGRPAAIAKLDTASVAFQYGVVGRPVNAAPVAKVADRFGNGIEGVPVTFTLSSSLGSLVNGNLNTDAAGLARLASRTLGRTAGSQFVRAAATGLPDVQFTAFGTPASLIPISPTQQSGNVGTAAAAPPAVRALDGDGQPLAGVEVVFTVRGGGGTVGGGSGISGSDGTVRARSWVLGPGVGENRVEATTVGLTPLPVFSATSNDPPPAAMAGIAGGGQAGFFDNFVVVPPVVRVVDASGKAIAGKTVTFELVSGGGALAGSTQVVDPNGLATLGGWRLGPSGANQEVRATLPGLPPVTFRVSATPVPASGYSIALRFVGGVPPASQDSIFRAAVARWSRLVVGDQPDVPIDFAADPDGCYPALHETVDDLVIYVRILTIDGVGGVLGAAGPCLARDDNLIPAVGVLLLDVADLADLEFKGTLGDVVVHELAHVMGFGETIWRLKGLFNDDDPSGPVFLGASARAAYAAIVPASVTTFLVPLENIGGVGTRNSHWRESVFGNELMTGFANQVNPLSAVSVAAMRDLGYLANDAIADPFTLAGPTAAPLVSRSRLLHTAPWSGPLVTIDRRGRPARVFR